MNNKIKQFNHFLTDIIKTDPIIEAIQAAFNIIFESTEDVVDKLKNKVPKTPEKTEELPTEEEEGPKNKSYSPFDDPIEEQESFAD
jgi:hypothetical protein